MAPEIRKTTPTKKPAQKKATAAKQAVKQAAGNLPAKKKGNSGTQLTPEERYRLIQESAYYMAEKAGFAGNSVDYWLAAEQEVNRTYQ